MSRHSSISSHIHCDEEEELDPRVQVELEKLNAATDEINLLEATLEDANNQFRARLNETSGLLQNLGRRLGSCVEKSRPYYEATERAKRLQIDCQRAALHYQRANAVHHAARETISLAEDRFSSTDSKNWPERKFDSAWQEMLNHATMKLLEAEAQKTASEREHQLRAAAYTAAEKEVQELYKKLRSSITKSQPYFNQRLSNQMQLETQKSRIHQLQKDVSNAKLKYSRSLRNLEQISEEIHESRRSTMKREPGVGAEFNPPHSKANGTSEFWGDIKNKFHQLTTIDSEEGELGSYTNFDLEGKAIALSVLSHENSGISIPYVEEENSCMNITREKDFAKIHELLAPTFVMDVSSSHKEISSQENEKFHHVEGNCIGNETREFIGFNDSKTLSVTGFKTEVINDTEVREENSSLDIRGSNNNKNISTNIFGNDISANKGNHFNVLKMENERIKCSSVEDDTMQPFAKVNTKNEDQIFTDKTETIANNFDKKSSFKSGVIAILHHGSSHPSNSALNKDNHNTSADTVSLKEAEFASVEVDCNSSCEFVRSLDGLDSEGNVSLAEVNNKSIKKFNSTITEHNNPLTIIIDRSSGEKLKHSKDICNSLTEIDDTVSVQLENVMNLELETPPTDEEGSTRLFNNTESRNKADAVREKNLNETAETMCLNGS